jgi:hypothetical protein
MMQFLYALPGEFFREAGHRALIASPTMYIVQNLSKFQFWG